MASPAPPLARGVHSARRNAEGPEPRAHFGTRVCRLDEPVIGRADGKALDHVCGHGQRGRVDRGRTKASDLRELRVEDDHVPRPVPAIPLPGQAILGPAAILAQARSFSRSHGAHDVVGHRRLPVPCQGRGPKHQQHPHHRGQAKARRGDQPPGTCDRPRARPTIFSFLAANSCRRARCSDRNRGDLPPFVSNQR